MLDAFKSTHVYSLEVRPGERRRRISAVAAAGPHLFVADSHGTLSRLRNDGAAPAALEASQPSFLPGPAVSLHAIAELSLVLARLGRRALLERSAYADRQTSMGRGRKPARTNRRRR